MAINRTKDVRSDFPFLTRRIKPAAAAPPPAAASPAVRPPSSPAAPPPSSPAAPSQSAPPAAPPSSAPPAAPPLSPGLSLSRPTTPRLGTQPPPPRTEARLSAATPLSLGLSPAAEASAARTRTAGPGRKTPQARGANPAARLFPAPAIDEIRTLDEKTPLIRLSPLQSAIGSLLVTGTRAVVWEATDLTTGARTAESSPSDITGTEVQTAGNRLLLDYVEQVAVVPLRHVGELRRALFIPRPDTTMLVEIYDGGTVAVPFDAKDPTGPAGSPERLMQVLSLLRVGNQVELRAEPLPAGRNLRQIWAEFGFTMTESVSASLRRN